MSYESLRECILRLRLVVVRFDDEVPHVAPDWVLD
jgi:hypothetical protein